MEIKKGIYRHYKGNDYRVLGIAVHSETLEKMVYYECLYENDLSMFWVRPAHMFTDDVWVGGQKIPRFKFISDE